MRLVRSDPIGPSYPGRWFLGCGITRNWTGKVDLASRRDTSPPSVPRSPRIMSSYCEGRASVGIIRGRILLLLNLQNRLLIPTSLHLSIQPNAQGAVVTVVCRIVESPRFYPLDIRGHQGLYPEAEQGLADRERDCFLPVPTSQLVERHALLGGEVGPNGKHGPRFSR